MNGAIRDLRRPAVAVVNARMGSSRLPGKALREIRGKPLLGYLLDRLARASTLDNVIVATSELQANDAIAEFCAARNTACFRGSEDDVLGRTLGALQRAGARTGVIAFGDGPLLDPAVVDHIVATYIDSDPPLDFAGNDLRTSYPPGMEVEAFSVAALADADRLCTDPTIREHGTLFLRRHAARYRLLNLEAPAHLRRPDLTLEVDTDADLDVIRAIVDHFGAREDFTLAEMIAFLDANPLIVGLNRAVTRRWKAFRDEG